MPPADRQALGGGADAAVRASTTLYPFNGFAVGVRDLVALELGIPCGSPLPRLAQLVEKLSPAAGAREAHRADSKETLGRRPALGVRREAESERPGRAACPH